MVYFELLGNAHILVYYPIISYQSIEVYRIEKMGIGIFLWNNGVSGKLNTSKYYITYCTGKIFWEESYGVERCHIAEKLLTPNQLIK